MFMLQISPIYDHPAQRRPGTVSNSLRLIRPSLLASILATNLKGAGCGAPLGKWLKKTHQLCTVELYNIYIMGISIWDDIYIYTHILWDSTYMYIYIYIKIYSISIYILMYAHMYIYIYGL